ncbi:hypothetical protein D3C85_1687410 [compost metagenome]
MRVGFGNAGEIHQLQVAAAVFVQFDGAETCVLDAHHGTPLSVVQREVRQQRMLGTAHQAYLG